MKRKIFTLLLTIICVFIGEIGCLYGLEKQTIKIGYYPIDGYHNVDDQGQVTGYEIDYLTEVAIINGWNLEYIKADTLQELYNMLDNHTVDIISPCEMNEELMEDYYFSSEPIFSGSAIVMTLEDYLIDYNEFDYLSSMILGIERGSQLEDAIIEFSQEEGFECHLQYFDNHQDLLSALDEGRVDGVVASMMEYQDQYRLAVQFHFHACHFMSYSQNIMTELDQAVFQLFKTNSDIKKTLLDKYFPNYSKAPFTKEELEFIDQVKTLRIGCSIMTDPLCYEEDGEIQGIIIDILERVSEYTHIDFEYVALPVGKISYEDIAAMNIDLLADVEFNQLNDLETRMDMSMPYLKTEKAIAAESGVHFYNDIEATIAITSGSASIRDVIHESYPNLKIEYYEDLDQAFYALQTNQVQFVLQNQYTLEKELQKPSRQGYNIISKASIGDLKCLSSILYQGEDLTVNEKTSDPLLMNVLNKGILSLSEHEVDQIVTTKTIERHHQYTIHDFIETNRVLIALLCVLLVIVVICIIYITKTRTLHIKNLKNQNLKLETLSKKDGLTGLLNKTSFEELTQYYIKHYVNEQCTFLFLDIDNFKTINDDLGHMTGDKVLYEVGTILEKHFRHNSYIARFGGDEFCVMYPCQSLEQLEKHLKDVLVDISQILGDNHVLTVSVGCIYFTCQQQDYLQLLDMADQALYQAKAAGKNQYVILQDK